MRYLFSDWKKLKQKLTEAQLFLFLDYDGTLVPIAEVPRQAIMPESLKALLASLIKLRYLSVAIISGRTLGNLKNMVGLKNIIYAGNHGLQIQGPKIKFKSPVSSSLRLKIQKVGKTLKQKLSKINGVLLENKGLTLSLHYRLVDKKLAPRVKNVFYETVAGVCFKGDVAVQSGKKVFEVRPAVDWDKGVAAEWLLKRQHSFLKGRKALPIYVGDDTTDEDAFKALKKKGLTVFVGKPKASRAQYYLKNTRDVSRFLKKILELKKGGT